MGRLHGVGINWARGVVLGVAGACALACFQPAPSSAVTGSVLGAGQNLFGQLGNGTTTGSDLPTPVSGLSDITALDGRERGGLALLGDGSVMAWGSNEVGQLGNGTTEPSLLPAAVPGLSEVTAISSFGRFSLALLANGTVVAWGANSHGQLGNGTTENSGVPVPVSGLSGVVAIAAGEAHSLALLENGEVLAWGSNVHGQSGGAGSEDSLTPVAVPGLSGVTAIAAGQEHSLALTSAGTIWAWGNGARGRLGNGELADSHVPVPVSGISDAVAIAAGARHNLALHSGGTVSAWGDDEFGQLGDGKSGTGIQSATPVTVSGLAGVSAISGGLYSSLALRADKTVSVWGGNEWGQLGIGEEGFGSKRSLPVMMCGVVEAGGVAGGNLASYVFGVTSTAPCPGVSAISPDLGPQSGGTSVTITGSGFTGATAVEFGTTAASEFTVNSPTSITAVTPPITPGPNNKFAQVRVKTPAGTSPSYAEFGYLAPPKIEKLSPHKGSAAGGTTVTITGSNYYSAGGIELQAVKFGSTNAASFERVVVKGKAAIKAISPPMTGGTVDVTLTTQGGTSAHLKADQFKSAPVVSGVTPSSGSRAGGASVTVTGAGFALGSATQIKFGTTKVRSLNCPTTTECIVVVPPRAPGVVDVKVTANKSSSAKNAPADQFTYE